MNSGEKPRLPNCLAVSLIPVYLYYFTEEQIQDARMHWFCTGNWVKKNLHMQSQSFLELEVKKEL